VKLEAAYPVVVTDKLDACRDFYTTRLGFEIVFEATWFVYLTVPGSPHRIAFMAPDHPSQPPGPEAFPGAGILLTLQVEDAAAEYERLRHAGVDVDHALTDEPWGQRRFGVRDPAGVWVDIVQQIDPAPGYWDQYTV
jgi:catechol 2,3-dioxygenase-like lactoylglutathione lyase family enzyme